jgi:hypothetical protein
LLNGRGDRIRTYDPLVPNQMRYQTALRPDETILSLVGPRPVFTTKAQKSMSTFEAQCLFSFDSIRDMT